MSTTLINLFFSVLISFALFIVFFGLTALARRWVDPRRRRGLGGHDEAFSDPGVSVEVDCRACGQFNRVPSHRLRDRPKCGRCKASLMPGTRVAVCRVRPMEGSLRAELEEVWTDEDQLWQSLANHVAIEAKAAAESKSPNLRVMN